jgi:hypothetical protein
LHEVVKAAPLVGRGASDSDVNDLPKPDVSGYVTPWIGWRAAHASRAVA